MRGYGNAARQAERAAFAAVAAVQVRATSDAAAAGEAIGTAAGDITGGATETIADLKARMDAAGIPP